MVMTMTIQILLIVYSVYIYESIILLKLLITIMVIYTTIINTY